MKPRSRSKSASAGKQASLLETCKEQVFSEPGESHISFDGNHYTYVGYVLQKDQQHYLLKTYILTPDDAGVLPTCDPERIRLMLDAVGRDPRRQEEIRRYGRRRWHNPYRPEVAVSQALDYAFAHGHVFLTAALAPYLADLYACDASFADAWTEQLHEAYLSYRSWHDADPLLTLLREQGVPDAIFLNEEGSLLL